MKEESECLMKSVLTQSDRHKNRWRRTGGGGGGADNRQETHQDDQTYTDGEAVESIEASSITHGRSADGRSNTGAEISK